jgi:hypothetical protein
MKWFRLYHDLPSDRKLRRFTVQQKWAWIVLLCLASDSAPRGVIVGEDEDDIADYCGFESTQDYQYFLDKLRQRGMIEPIPNGIKISKWDERQFESDSSSARVARHRAAKNNAPETLQEASQERDSIAPENREQIQKSESDPESETKPEKRQVFLDPISVRAMCRKGGFQTFWDDYRKRCTVLGGHSPGRKQDAEKAWAERFNAGEPDQQFVDCFEAFWSEKQRCFTGGQFSPAPPTFENYLRNPESYEELAIARQQLLAQAPQLANPQSAATAFKEAESKSQWAQYEAEARARLAANGGAA